MSECVYEPWPDLRCHRTENPKPRQWWCYRCSGTTRSLRECFAKIERAILDRAGAPHMVLMGVPSASGMYFDGVPRFRNEFMGYWTAAEADERSQRCDDHVAAINYALTGRRSGKADAAKRIAEAVRAAGGEAMTSYPCGCDRRFGQCSLCAEAVAPPKPPTLREWLGDRVSELGRWAEVLREQPVPAGWIERWTWDRERGVWLMSGAGVRDCAVDPDLAMQYLNRRNDSMQMALFTRHPAVKPAPKLRTWFGNEEEV
jgi:hypothetical protein